MKKIKEKGKNLKQNRGKLQKIADVPCPRLSSYYHIRMQIFFSPIRPFTLYINAKTILFFNIIIYIFIKVKLHGDALDLDAGCICAEIGWLSIWTCMPYVRLPLRSGAGSHIVFISVVINITRQRFKAVKRQCAKVITRERFTVLPF